jgi:hypothetical protein
MNPLHGTDLARQQARAWSGQLGALAATSSTTRRGAALPQLDPTLPSDLPTRLSVILHHIRKRSHRREHAADKLRANEFMTGQ